RRAHDDRDQPAVLRLRCGRRRRLPVRRLGRLPVRRLGRLPGLRRGRWRGDGHENSSSWGFSEPARTELPVRAAFTPAPRPRFGQTTEPWRADNQGYHLRAVATVRANAYSQATLTRHATRRDRGDRRADFHVGDRGAGRRAAPRGEQLAAGTP